MVTATLLKLKDNSQEINVFINEKNRAIEISKKYGGNQ